jgi:hypothetical protein
MIVPVPAQTPHNVFHLSGPAMLLWKLAWEVRQLNRSTAPDIKQSVADSLSPAYCAFNCAVTAWHVSDWAWQSADPETQQKIASRLGFSLASDDERNFDRFADAICTRSRELRICREIAKGSKHKKLRRPDKSIIAKARFNPVVEPVGRFQIGGHMLELTVADEHGELCAIRIFARAFEF